MQKKVMSWKTKGMNQDLSVSAFNPEFSFENINLRLSTNDGNTMLSWVNEKGPKRISIKVDNAPWSTNNKKQYYILGKTIGTAVINHQLVLFTTTYPQSYNGNPDHIYVLKLNADRTVLEGKALYHGNLNFNTSYPIETLTSYEAEHIQKVYWTDGFNQPRVINIAVSDNKLSKWNSGSGVDTFFDFVPSMKLNEEVTITKNTSSGGTFEPGVIQYAFTYINKYSQQSNIFYVSPIYYLTYGDRGAKPDEMVTSSFTIDISNADKNFDYVRIYSIHRTSLNLDPIVKQLDDIPIRGTTHADSFRIERVYSNLKIFSLPRDEEGKIFKLNIYNGSVTVNMGTGTTGYVGNFRFAAVKGGTSSDFCSLQYIIDKIAFDSTCKDYYECLLYYAYIKITSSIDSVIRKLMSEELENGPYNDWKFTISNSSLSPSQTVEFTRANMLGKYLVYNYLDQKWYILTEGQFNEITTSVIRSSGSQNTIDVHYIDNGTTGAVVDAHELLQVGGKEITALTMADKDSTLFLGNITQNTPIVDDIQDYYDYVRETSENPQSTLGIAFDYDTNNSSLKTISVDPVYGSYSYTNFMKDYHQRQMSTFKGGETYRLGYQLQKATGEWTEPIFLADALNDKYPLTSAYSDTIKLPYATAEIDLSDVVTYNENVGKILDISSFVKIRPVIVYPTIADRTVLCQGVLNPTVFNAMDRIDNSPFAQASWYFRPNADSASLDRVKTEDVTVKTVVGTLEDDNWNVHVETIDDVNSENYTIDSDSYFYNHKEYVQNVYVLVASIIDGSTGNVGKILNRGYLDYKVSEEYSSGFVKAKSGGATVGGGNTLPPGSEKILRHDFFGVIRLDDDNVSPTFAFVSKTEWPRETIVEEQYGDEWFKTTTTTYSIENVMYIGYAGRQFELPSDNGGMQSTSIVSTLYYSKPSFLPENDTEECIVNSFIFRFYINDFKRNGQELNAAYKVTFRHINISTESTDSDSSTNIYGEYVPYVHYDSLLVDSSTGHIPTAEEVADAWQEGSDIVKQATNFRGVEIQGSTAIFNHVYSECNTEDNSENPKQANTQFFVDQSIVTLNSPDIEFDTMVQKHSMENLKLRIIGAIPITGDVSAHHINASAMLETNHNGSETNSNNFKFGAGELNYNILHNNRNLYSGMHLTAATLWEDVALEKDSKKEDGIITGNNKFKFLIFPWHKSGSLNNDWRAKGEASSWLNTKKESNLLYSAETEYFNSHGVSEAEEDIDGDVDYNVSAQIALTENDEVFNYRLPKQTTSEESSNEINYYPNIDKVLVNPEGINYYYFPPLPKGKKITYEELVNYMKGGYSYNVSCAVPMKYKSTSHAVIALNAATSGDDSGKIPILPYVLHEDTGPLNHDSLVGKYNAPTHTSEDTTFWGKKPDFVQASIKTDKLFMRNNTHISHRFLWLGELYKDVEKKFGGDSKEAVRNNTWCICGDAVKLNNGVATLHWTAGDTYYQRYDCLKTYAYTKEDTNQLVEILSFMCETHVNIDGRYDRNRGQKVSYNMHPTIFNLWNPVYSQKDNFFGSRKLDTEDMKKLEYPNYINYTMTKNPGADVDMWTHISLGSTLELDGSKGKVSSLMRFNDQLIAFQDTGISQILYNENMQMSTTQGVPIEIANSGKVNGKRYLSSSVGCSNKWSIADTPNGIYFMDNHNKAIYLFNGQLQNISLSFGFNSWSKKNIPSPDEIWNPDAFNSFVTYYDRQNQDVLFINKDTALAFSEKFNTFTSFYDYGQSQYLCNLDDESIWIRNIEGIFFDAAYDTGDISQNGGIRPGATDTPVPTPQGAPAVSPSEGSSSDSASDAVAWEGNNIVNGIFSIDYNSEFMGTHSNLYLHNKGQYGKFFSDTINKPFSMILVGNPEPQLDKIFTNLEFRACVLQDVDTQHDNVFWRPFNTLETWNEYQHGIAELKNMSGHAAMLHHRTDTNDASLKRKFRIWRCDIPRDNAPLNTDAELGISRLSAHPLDRMRNPWLYLKLTNEELGGQAKVEIHDIAMTYYE